MRAYIDDTLVNCCGIVDAGQFMNNNDVGGWDLYNHPKIKDFPTEGCGIFVATFLPSQRTAMQECSRYHTLLFKTGPHKNTGHHASLEGKTKGVYLCVYKYGKDTAK